MILRAALKPSLSPTGKNYIIPMVPSEDLEKFEFYLKAKFEFCDSLLFSNLVKKPAYTQIKELKNKLSKFEIERLYNHFHISAISKNIKKQREYATEIWKKWRSVFDQEMQDRNIVIEIHDLMNEIIIYVYEH